jgi:hypothetical protein
MILLWNPASKQSQGRGQVRRAKCEADNDDVEKKHNNEPEKDGSSRNNVMTMKQQEDEENHKAYRWIA